MVILRPPHASLGPGIPDPPVDLPATPHKHRHRIPDHLKVVAHPVLGALHHEYGFVEKADGFEFDVVATVYDKSKVSGLSGSVVRQRGTEIQSAASKSALASAKALMTATVDNAAAGVLADGVGQVGEELLNHERRLIREPRFLIQVSPQPVLVSVNQTF